MLLAKTIGKDVPWNRTSRISRTEFYFSFSKGSLPNDITTVKCEGETKTSLIELLLVLNMLNSKSEAKRMIENKGVRVNGEKVEDIHFHLTISDGLIIQVGKRKFVQIQLHR